MKIALFKNNQTPKLARYQKIHMGARVHRTWYRLLFGFAVMLLLVTCSSLFLFYRIMNESIFIPDPKAPENVVPVAREKLEKVLERFRVREDARTLLEYQTPIVIDPSVKR